MKPVELNSPCAVWPTVSFKVYEVEDLEPPVIFMVPIFMSKDGEVRLSADAF